MSDWQNSGQDYLTHRATEKALASVEANPTIRGLDERTSIAPERQIHDLYRIVRALEDRVIVLSAEVERIKMIQAKDARK